MGQEEYKTKKGNAYEGSDEDVDGRRRMIRSKQRMKKNDDDGAREK